MDPQQIVVPGRTYVFVAPVGTTAPADATAVLGTGWRNVGHTTPDSLTFATQPDFQEVDSAQSDYPVRRFQTKDAATINVDLLEWSAGNMKAAFGGGTITEIGTTGSGQFKFVPPSIGNRSEVAVILQVEDGGKHYRYVVPRAMQIEGIELQLQKGKESALALRLAVLGGDVGDPFYLLTDDPAFDPAA